MKKLFLMLLIVVSCSLSAQTNRETGINSGFDFLKLHKWLTPPQFLNKLKTMKPTKQASLVCKLVYNSSDHVLQQHKALVSGGIVS